MVQFCAISGHPHPFTFSCIFTMVVCTEEGIETGWSNSKGFLMYCMSQSIIPLHAKVQ